MDLPVADRRSHNTELRSRAAVALLVMVVVSTALVSCTSPDSGAGPAATEAVSIAAEDVRDEVVAMLEDNDAAGLEQLLPAETWDAVKGLVLDGFTPSRDNGECVRPSDTTRECFIFDQNDPFVLALTMSLEGSEWRPTVVSYDSTD